jgi:hypothetical protein
MGPAAVRPGNHHAGEADENGRGRGVRVTIRTVPALAMVRWREPTEASWAGMESGGARRRAVVPSGVDRHRTMPFGRDGGIDGPHRRILQRSRPRDPFASQTPPRVLRRQYEHPRRNFGGGRENVSHFRKEEDVSEIDLSERRRTKPH